MNIFQCGKIVDDEGTLNTGESSCFTLLYTMLRDLVLLLTFR